MCVLVLDKAGPDMKAPESHSSTSDPFVGIRQDQGTTDGVFLSSGFQRGLPCKKWITYIETFLAEY